MRRGMHHIGLTTCDYDRCVDFYTRVLGFEIATQMVETTPDGTVLFKHVFFDTGDGTYMAFIALTPASGMPAKWACDINSAVGVPTGFYHFALWLDTLEELEAMQRRIREAGHPVSDAWDHDFCHSIYLRDPDGFTLEFSVTVRELTEADKGPLLNPPLAYVDNTKKGRALRTSEAIGIPPEMLPPGLREEELEPAGS